MAVPRRSFAKWRRYLHANGLTVGSRKRIGTRIDLVAVDEVKVTFLEGEPLIPRTAVIKLSRSHPAIFANAEELVVDSPR